MSLAFGQWELNGVKFGDGTNIAVKPDWTISSRSFRTQDMPVPFGDGRVFGRDEVEGSNYTWTLLCLGNGPNQVQESRNLERRLSAVWRGDGVRLQPGEVTELRTNVWGAGTVRILGRPRKYKPDPSYTITGVYQVEAQFASVDDLYYDDNYLGSTVGLFAEAQTGVAGPWTGPVSAAAPGTEQSVTFFNPGDVPTQYFWVTFTGPVTNPAVQIAGLGKVTLRTTVEPGQSATLYFHPSMRAAVLSNGKSLSAQVEQDVDKFALPTGNVELRYVADNLTGTTTMTVTAYPAYVSV